MENDKKIFGVRKNIFFLGLVSFFNDFSAEIVQSVMPAFLTVTLGAPAFFVGFIEGAADALASTLKPISGWFSDKIGKRKGMAVLGYSISVGIRLFLTLAQNFWQVFGLRMGDRIGKGMRDAPRDAMIAESVPREELGRSYGLHRAMDALGATLGPLLAFFLLPFLGGSYRVLFLISFFLGLGAIGSFVLVKEKGRDDEKDRPQVAPTKLKWDIFKENKKFIFIVLTIFIFGLGALPTGLILLKTREIGSIGQIPLMYFVYSLIFVLASVPLGRLADKIGGRIVIIFGFLFAIISYLGLAQASHIMSMTIFFITLGIYSAATDGIQRKMAAQMMSKHLLATGQGFLNMALGFSSLVAGVLGGILWTKFGSSSALYYAAIFSFLGLVVFIIVSKIKKGPVD